MASMKVCYNPCDPATQPKQKQKPLGEQEDAALSRPASPPAFRLSVSFSLSLILPLSLFLPLSSLFLSFASFLCCIYDFFCSSCTRTIPASVVSLRSTESFSFPPFSATLWHATSFIETCFTNDDRISVHFTIPFHTRKSDRGLAIAKLATQWQLVLIMRTLTFQKVGAINVSAIEKL
jgi:hypothetical protein